MTDNKQIINQCPVAKKCGGCQLTNMTYEQQLSWKQRRAISLLGKFAHVNEICGMKDPFHYRNKVQAAFGTTRGGAIISGVYQSSTHNIVKVDSCMIEDVTADEIIVTIRNMIKSFRLGVYDERTRKGFLRHVLIKRGFATNEVMVVLVTGTVEFPSKNAFVKELVKRHPCITTVVQNVNNAFTSLVLGEKELVLYGDGYISDILCSLRFRISPKSFYQINPVQTEAMYSYAIKIAEINRDSRVLDAYCGIGTIGLIASQSAKEVVGIELNPEAVKDAKFNARLNSVDNIQFICADAGKMMVEAAKHKEKFDVVIMDPPRAGSDINFMSSVVRLSPKKIVYISCNPETLARDLLYFSKHKYKIKRIQPFDMFPHTSHIETVVMLSRAGD